MAQTLAQITKQIEKLQKEADALRKTEVKGVVERIRAAISHYGLTPDQLGFGKSSVTTQGPRKAVGGKSTAPRFANAEGQVWSGRGPRPRWLREALASGRSLDEFSTAGKAGKSGGGLEPGKLSTPQATKANVVERAKKRVSKKSASSKPASVLSSQSSNAASTVKAAAVTEKATKPARKASAKSARPAKTRAAKSTLSAVKSAPRPKAKRRGTLASAVGAAASAPATNEKTGAASSGAAAT